MRVITIFARHGNEKYRGAEERLAELFTKQLPEVRRKILIVDNLLPAGLVRETSEDETVIGGDNSSWEFSAWDRGIAYLGSEIWSFDLVNLVTSAFDTLYVKYLDRFDGKMLHAIAGLPVCAGHIDCYCQPIRIRQFPSQHWIRTSFLFTMPSELKALSTLISVNSPSEFFGSEPSEPFASDAPLSDNYREYVIDWLTGRDIGQGSVWHSRLALDEKAMPMFRAKATAIFNEQLLGIRLRAQGTKLVDTTWLATQLQTHEARGIPWDTTWREQLSQRDVDRVVAG